MQNIKATIHKYQIGPQQVVNLLFVGGLAGIFALTILKLCYVYANYLFSLI
jgi:hypothetical protein